MEAAAEIDIRLFISKKKDREAGKRKAVWMSGNLKKRMCWLNRKDKKRK